MNKLNIFKISTFLVLSLLLAPIVIGIALNNSSSQALAQPTTSGTTVDDNFFVYSICKAYATMTGKGGKAFAAIAIISCAIGFFTGKVSWGLLIAVSLGIAVMFGAPSIIGLLGGGSFSSCN